MAATMTVEATAATMIDPLLPDRGISASSAERLAALRQPSTSKKRTKPAHTSKIVSAGISTTALFGMVAVMGWHSGTSVAQSSAPPVATAPVAPTVAPLVPTAPSTTGVLVTPLPVAPVPAATVPAATVPPTTVPPAPIQVPVATPAPRPVVQVNAAPAQSHTTTKSSG